MTACLKKVECERIENFRKKNQPMVIGENARKKNKREKVKGMTACLKKVECEQMENLKNK